MDWLNFSQLYFYLTDHLWQLSYAIFYQNDNCSNVTYISILKNVSWSFFWNRMLTIFLLHVITYCKTVLFSFWQNFLSSLSFFGSSGFPQYPETFRLYARVLEQMTSLFYGSWQSLNRVLHVAVQNNCQAWHCHFNRHTLNTVLKRSTACKGVWD
jgi:hypothetical protein